MRVGVDATSSVVGGGVSYLRGLLPALVECDETTEYLLFVSRRNAHLFQFATPRIRTRTVGFPAPLGVWRLLWQVFGSARASRRAGCDVLLCPANIGPLVGSVPVVVMILNIAPFVPAVTRAERSWRRRVRWIVLSDLSRRAAQHADLVGFLSDYSRRLVSPLLAVGEDRSFVAHLGYDEAMAAGTEEVDSVLARHGVARPFALTVTAFSRHKNVHSLVEAWTAVRPSGVSLAIAADVRDRGYYREVRSAIRRSGLDSQVRLLGYVSRADLAALYRAAEVFVFTSLCENNPNVVLEAMISGTPIAASGLPSIHEVAGDAALYFDAEDPKSIARTVSLLLCTPELRARLRDSGLERARSFAWRERSAAVLEAILAAARGRRAGGTDSGGARSAL